jgi:hypothetical protein
MGNDFATGYAIGQNDSKNCCSDGGMGAWGAWLIPLLLIGLLFGGFGGGFGFGGFGGGAGLQGIATRADINAGFQFNNLENGIRGIQQGICDSTYALNNSIMTGFHGVDNAICNLGYNVQQGFNTLGYQNQQCCCETQRLMERGFCDIGYNMATSTSNIVQAGHSDTDRVIAKLDAMERERLSDKLEAVRMENQTLRFAASQAEQNAYIAANQQAQTAELIRRLGRDCPVPAYVVPNPNCCYGNPVGVGYNNGGSGCPCFG